MRDGAPSSTRKKTVNDDHEATAARNAQRGRAGRAKRAQKEYWEQAAFSDPAFFLRDPPESDVTATYQGPAPTASTRARRTTEHEDSYAETFECEAVLFDLDGVLVDSGAAVARVWRNWAAACGVDAARILDVAHGRRTVETIRLVAPDLDAELEAAELERIEAGDLEGVLEAEGARRLLSALPPEAWNVVTSGTRLLARSRMEHVGLTLPERAVTADGVQRGKPHPEPYLRGAKILGVLPEACVAIEDAPSGVRAAKAASMRVVAVATTHRRADLREADAVVETLAKIDAVRRPRLALRVAR